MDHSRDPCPWVILNDFGGAFAMGVCPLSAQCLQPITNCGLGCWRSSMARRKRRKYGPGVLKKCAYEPAVP
ncbi:hypothetical protein IG631_08931 [Alternaria alternata]|nr:hypothetical protein IG631_08931 [Alternaria alternata]